MNATNQTARVVAIVNMLSSEHEGERANAAGMLRRMAETARKPVADMLRECMGAPAQAGVDVLLRARHAAELDAATRALATVRRELSDAMIRIRNLTASEGDHASRAARYMDRAASLELQLVAANRQIEAMRANATTARAPAPAANETQRADAHDTGPVVMSTLLRDQLRAMLASDDCTRWERDFLSDVIRRNRALSERQYAIVRRIKARGGVPHDTLPPDPAPAPTARPEPAPRPAQAPASDYQAQARATARANVDPNGACPF